MNIEQRQLTTITPYDNNPRVNDGAVDAVAASIREFGFRQALVLDERGVQCFVSGWVRSLLPSDILHRLSADAVDAQPT